MREETRETDASREGRVGRRRRRSNDVTEYKMSIECMITVTMLVT